MEAYTKKKYIQKKTQIMTNVPFKFEQYDLDGIDNLNNSKNDKNLNVKQESRVCCEVCVVS